jgi:DNA-binding LacI/PurR family transcriptional regulator
LRPDTLRRLRGVFTFHPLWDVEDKLEAAGVPVVVLAVDGGPHRVWFDLPAFVKGCVDHLAEAGCRRVCLLQPEHEGPTPPALRPDVVTWCGQAAAARGVAMQVVTAAFDDRGVTERTGHELFMRYWAQPKRAEGIIVCDDVLCSGVLRAMLQLGLEAPRDLRLVTHANRGVALPYHRAVTRFELDVDRLADAAVEMLARLLDGHAPVEAVRIVPLDFVKGETS